MHEQMSKRAFLRGRFRERSHIRPPGTEARLYDLCTRCGKCGETCPTNIIFFDDLGLPAVNLSEGACLFCSECANVCEAEAIKPATEWAVRAKVLPSCLSYNGTTCRTCEDHCDEQAIRFRLMTGGRSVPQIDLDTCTGCGSCAVSCPSSSIKFNERHI